MIVIEFGIFEKSFFGFRDIELTILPKVVPSRKYKIHKNWSKLLFLNQNQIVCFKGWGIQKCG